MKPPVPAKPVGKRPGEPAKRPGKAKARFGWTLLVLVALAAAAIAFVPAVREEALRFVTEKRWLPTWGFAVVAVAPVLVVQVWLWLRRRRMERPRTDMDVAVVIVDWIRRNPKKMKSAVSFSRLDRELGLARGTSKRLLVPSALRCNYSVEMMGERRVLFSMLSLMGGGLRDPKR